MWTSETHLNRGSVGNPKETLSGENAAAFYWQRLYIHISHALCSYLFVCLLTRRHCRVLSLCPLVSEFWAMYNIYIWPHHARVVRK